MNTAFPVSTVEYQIEPMAEGTRITFRHGDFASPEATEANRAGWETSFTRLLEIVA